MVVTFVLQNPLAIDRPLFVYYQPTFQSRNECHLYVARHNLSIFQRAHEKMGAALQPEAIFCITEAQVKEMHDYTLNNPKKEQI
jgi:hypothetical protein